MSRTAKLSRPPMSEEERERLRDQLRRQDPAPFAELMLDALAQKPTEEAWRKLAETAPDKYTKAVRQIGGGFLGYNESLLVQHTHRHLIDAMSDSELAAFIREKRQALPLIEVEAVEVKSDPPKWAAPSHGPSAQDLRDAGVPATKEPDPESR